MLEFISNILFKNRLADLDGKPGVSEGDAEILIEKLELPPSDSEEVIAFCDEADRSLYIPTSKISSFVANLDIPDKQVSLYGMFRNLFGADIDWSHYFPGLESKRHQVLESVYKRLYGPDGQPSDGARFTDFNRWINSKNFNPELYSVGLNCFLFRSAGSIVCGEATSDFRSIQRNIEGKMTTIHHRMLMFDTIFDEKCLKGSGCQFDLAKFDSLYTLAVFVPRVREYLSDRFEFLFSAINTLGVFSGFSLAAFAFSALLSNRFYDQVVDFIGTHEWAHIQTDRVESNVMSLSGYLKYKDDQGEKGDVVRRMFEMLWVAKETMPDLLAINQSAIYPLLYSLIRFAGSSVSSLEPPAKFASMMMTGVSPFTFAGFGERSSELSAFFSNYRDQLVKVILDQTAQWITENGMEKKIGEDIEGFCMVNSGGQKVNICSDQLIKDEIFFTRLAEYYWSDIFPSDPSVLKVFVDQQWQEYMSIQHELRKPQ